MKYSLNWLKEHLVETSSTTETLVREVTLRAFEVEEVEERGGDTLLEIKVLPDRAHDALSHRGMSREIGALLQIVRKEHVIEQITRNVGTPAVRVVIEDSKLCPRYIATRVDGVTVGPAPRDIADKIEIVGGRSINNVVDITNFVLFDIGQPLHVFDADKVIGGITVRLAKKGETMITLDNKPLALIGTELVIADDEGVLALAGIKGGKKAEVTSETTSIILESANFDPTLTRKTSEVHKIKTDASKRYENGMTSAFAGEGCDLALSLIALHGGSAVQIGETTDVYPVGEVALRVSISAHDVNRLLGLNLSTLEITEVLTRAGHAYDDVGENITIAIPRERLDLRIKEDLIEEIGRHVGYESIEAKLPDIKKKGVPHKRLFYANKIRKFLIEQGFSEVVTYSFARMGEGAIEVINPVGNDRPFMREELGAGIVRSLDQNAYYAPLIGLSDVRIFEIGNVFPLAGEHASCIIAVCALDKKSWKKLDGFSKSVTTDLFAHLGAGDAQVVHTNDPSTYTDTSRINFDALVAVLAGPTAYEPLATEDRPVRYQPLSQYPFIVRDIAIFVPQEVTEEYIEALLRKEAGELLVRFSQFDKFQKEGESRISYGYRMVFQSFDRTLTDEEVGAIMEGIMIMCHKEKDWTVR